MKKILITGVSGYIGSHLAERLRSNYQVIGLDLQQPQVNLYDFLNVDIRNIKAWQHEIDTVIHLAALVKVNESVSNPINYYDTNLVGTLNLLDKLRYTCKNFIFASTGSAEYCNNPYGISKKAAEDCIKEFCLQNNILYTTFRFYNVIGSKGFSPTNPDGLFYNLIKARQRGVFTIFGNNYNTVDGTAERDYVHVDEICAAIEKAVDYPANTIENLGHGRGHTVKQITDLFKKINNCNFEVLYGPRRAGDLERSVLNNPSSYLPNLYGIDELVKIPFNML